MSQPKAKPTKSATASRFAAAESPRINRFATAATTRMNMNHTKDEIMSKNNVGQDFEETLKTKAKFVALFYASWCPFSRKFLPIYEKCTANNPNPCIRVMIDDKEDLCEKYSIQFYPTVLLFENGKVIKRLDAEPGAGLSEKQLKNLLNAT